MAEAAVRGARAARRRRSRRSTVTQAAFSNVEPPRAPLYFNQASPSAYVRGHTRAVPLALAYMRSLERLGARVLNGADVFALELSKSAQATLLRTLGIDTPRSITFNDVGALRALRRRRSRGRRCSSRIRAAAARASRSSSRWRRSRRSSPPIPTSGCRTTCSCCRSTCRTIPNRASSGWSSSAASCSMRCGSRRTAASTCARRRSAIPTRATACARCRQPTPCRRRRSSSFPYPDVPRRRGRDRQADRRRRRGSTSAASSISRPTTGGGCSTTSTPTRTCGRRSPRHSGFDPFERVVDYLVAQLDRSRSQPTPA